MKKSILVALALTACTEPPPPPPSQPAAASQPVIDPACPAWAQEATCTSGDYVYSIAVERIGVAFDMTRMMALSRARGALGNGSKLTSVEVPFAGVCGTMVAAMARVAKNDFPGAATAPACKHDLTLGLPTLAGCPEWSTKGTWRDGELWYAVAMSRKMGATDTNTKRTEAAASNLIMSAMDASEVTVAERADCSGALFIQSFGETAAHAASRRSKIVTDAVLPRFLAYKKALLATEVPLELGKINAQAVTEEQAQAIAKAQAEERKKHDLSEAEVAAAEVMVNHFRPRRGLVIQDPEPFGARYDKDSVARFEKSKKQIEALNTEMVKLLSAALKKKK